MWKGRNDELIVERLPDVSMEVFKKHWLNHSGSFEATPIIVGETTTLALEPTSYQLESLENWKRNKGRGIVQYATGAGKTLMALLAIRSRLDDGGSVVVIVPGKSSFDNGNRRWSKASVMYRFFW